MTAQLALGKGLMVTLAIDAAENILRLTVTDEDRGIHLAFASRDHMDNREGLSSLLRLENDLKGRKWFFHEKTRMDVAHGGVEIHTCPVDEETRAPVPALMAHYRFEPLPDQSALRITTWFTSPATCIAERLSWLRLEPVDCAFDSFAGYEPGYTGKLSHMKHAMRFPALAVSGPQGWAAWQACGEAIWIPRYPDYAPDEIERTEDMRTMGTFAPQATVSDDVNLTFFSQAHPLTGVLSFGTGTPLLPAVAPAPFSMPERVRGEIHSLHSGGLTAAIALREDGVSLLGIRLTDWSLSNAVPAAPLSRLMLRELSTGRVFSITTESGWAFVKIRQMGDGFLEIYLREPQGIVDFALRVTARAVSPGRIEWETRVLNGNTGYSVLNATYPGVSFEGGDPVLVTPEDSGTLIDHPYERGAHFSGVYPSGFCGTMPIFGLYDPNRRTNNGLYLAVHDPLGTRKDQRLHCTVDGYGALEIAFGAINMGKAANAFTLAGKMVWQVFDGDWYDIAMIYRAFVHAHARWLPRHGRPDSSAWMRDVPLYIMDWMPNDNPDADPIPISIRPKITPPRDDWYQTPIRLADALNLPFGYHLYNWHWIPFNNDFPHYFPVKEGLVEGVDAMRAHGIHVMPYINGRLWDTKDRRDTDYRFRSEALRDTSKSRNGMPDLETYASHEADGSLVELAAMCPTSALWRRVMLDTVLRLFSECHMDAVYLDQIAAAYVNLCCDETHNHTPGNGDWWIEAYRLLMDRLRAEMPDTCGFTTECNAEVYTDQFDGFLTWTWITSNLVPIFPAVYGGYVAMLGRNTNGYKKPDLSYYRYHVAQAVLFGQQIGWINPDLVDDPEKLSFLKHMATIRYEYRDFFSFGDMLRPPQVTGDVPRIVTDTGMGKSQMFDGTAVLAAAWRKRADATVLVLLANVGDEETAAHFTVDWDAYGTTPEALEAVGGEDFSIRPNETGIHCILPPHQCSVLLSSKPGL